jgi:modification methylase
MIEKCYQDKYVQLYCGDCLTVLPQLADDSFDVTLTSPPYNLRDPDHKMGIDRTENGKWRNASIGSGYVDYDDAMPFEEYAQWQRNVLKECWRVTSGAVYYNHKPRPVNGTIRLPLEWFELPLRQIVIWARAGGVNFSTSHYCPTHEWIMIGAKPEFKLKNQGASGVGDVWYIPQDSNTDHPAPFPIALAARVIETTGCNTIFDPYSGSGTVLLAAKLANIKAVGIEKSRLYCDQIIKRLSSQEVFEFESEQLKQIELIV